MKGAAKTESETDLSGTHLWLVMIKAWRALEHRAIESIESAGVGLSDFGVMEMLLQGPPAGETRSAAATGLTSGAITTAVGSSRARWSLVRTTRRPAGADRALDPAGRGAGASLFATHKKAMDSAAGGLSKTERATLIALLRKLGAHAEEHAAQPKEK